MEYQTHALENQIQKMLALGYHERVLRPYAKKGMTLEEYAARLMRYEIHEPKNPRKFARPLLIDPAVMPSVQME